MLALYKKLLAEKRNDADRARSRLSSGVQLLSACERIVRAQRDKLAQHTTELDAATEAAGIGRCGV